MCVNDGKQKLAMKEMKDEPDTCNGYFGEPPVQVVSNSTCVNDGKQKLAMEAVKDEPDTCNGYFGEPPVQVVTLRVSITVSKNWR